MSDSEEITKLKRLLIEVKGENVAFRCMLPVVLAELALTSDDPPAWMRQFHSQTSLIIDQYLQNAPGDTLRAPAMRALDDIAVAVRLRKIGDPET